MQILSINMEILGPLNIYGPVQRRDFIFRRRIQHYKFLPSDDKLPPKVGVVRVT